MSYKIYHDLKCKVMPDIVCQYKQDKKTYFDYYRLKRVWVSVVLQIPCGILSIKCCHVPTTVIGALLGIHGSPTGISLEKRNMVLNRSMILSKDIKLCFLQIHSRQCAFFCLNFTAECSISQISF